MIINQLSQYLIHLSYADISKEAIEKVGGTTATESLKEARINFYKSLANLGEEQTEIEGK